MKQNGTIIGCLTLQSPDLSMESDRLAHLKSRLTFPFTEMEVETGNHIVGYDNAKQAPFDYWIGGKHAEAAKMFVSSRAMQLSGLRVGEVTEDNLTRKCIQYLLALNTNQTEEERKKSYLDLAFSKVFNKISERFFLSLDLMSSAPKFVLMTRDIPVHFLGVCDDQSTYLMWTNESNLEERMREFYGDRFYYYRMKPFLNGMCVIQSVYLTKKLYAWDRMLRDKLKIMNALEMHLFRRITTEESVNDPATSNQPTA